MRWRPYRFAIVTFLGVTGFLLSEQQSAEGARQSAGPGPAAGRAQAAPDETTLLSEVPGKYLRVALRLASKPASPGDRVTLVADIVPGPKMHVYAPEQSGYIPVALKLAASTDFAGQPAKFPPATSFYYEPLKETVKVYDKPFRIQQDVTIARTPDVLKRAQSGEPLTISGTVSYQACDDAVCYRPDSVPVTWTIKLARSK
jgi:hypothetical protein